jgi:hypothetical protein
MGEHRVRVFENRMMRRIFGHKREEVMEGWKQLYSKEHHNLYFSPNIVSMMKLRRMRWVWYVVHMGEVGNVHRVKKCEGKNLLRDTGIDEQIIFKVYL